MRRGTPIGRALGVLVCALVLASCTGGDDGDDRPEAQDPGPPPTLEAEWSIPGLDTFPERAGTHHWMTQMVRTSGAGWYGRTTTYGPLVMVDARTGDVRRRKLPENAAPCLLPQSISDSGVTPVLRYSEEGCTSITVLDAAVGRTLWTETSPGLDGLSDRFAVGADDQVVVVADHRGRSVCFGARDGEPLADQDASCTELRDRLTHADLPELVDADGDSAPLAFGPDASARPVEIGRTDEVLLVLADGERDPRAVGHRPLVRAHDLGTGETLWQDADLTPDPHDGDAWSRDETYSDAPSGMVRVSYEHPEDAEEAHLTPMVLTAVDPLTGQDIRPVARVEGGAWFNRQFGETTVALTQQDLIFRSTISGFRLPTW